MKRRSTTIAFRLSDELLPLLDDECKRRKLSRGDYCRGLTVSFLMRPEREAHASSDVEVVAALKEEFAEMLSALVEQVEQGQTSVRRMLFQVLIRIGNVSDADAREIVRKVSP